MPSVQDPHAHCEIPHANCLQNPHAHFAAHSEILVCPTWLAPIPHPAPHPAQWPVTRGPHSITVIMGTMFP